MAIEQLKFLPTDLHVNGDPKTGEVWLHYRTNENKAISLQLSPKVLGETLLNLVLCASQSPNQATREVVQQLATRELHASVLPGPLLVLDQELECGLSMKLTLETKDAERLLGELQAGLDMIRSANTSTPH